PRTGPRRPERSIMRSSPASGPPGSRVPTATRTRAVPMSEPTSEAADAPVWQRRLVLADTDQMLAFGTRLARLVRAGDLIVLTGDLGAGKTTLVKGLGAGLDVRGRISSPTFIIARTHAPTGDGPALVHVDAYRLQGLAEVDDLDLDTAREQAVTVVERGAGVVEGSGAGHPGRTHG